MYRIYIVDLDQLTSVDGSSGLQSTVESGDNRIEYIHSESGVAQHCCKNVPPACILRNQADELKSTQKLCTYTLQLASL